MEQSEVEKIIEEIKSSGDLNHGLNVFRELPKNEKQSFLNSFKYMKDETAGIYLNALHDDETDKDIQKQIRKLLFVLKTLGVNVEEAKPKGKPVLKKIEEQRDHKALLSNYDDMGTRLVVAAYALKKNAFIFFNASTHFSEGLIELISGPIDRRGLEDILRGYSVDRPENMTLVEISPRYASYLLEEASERSGRYKEEIKQLKKFSVNIKDNVCKPEDIYKLRMPDTTRPMPIEKILDHPIFGSLYFKWDGIEEDKKIYANMGNATIVLPPYLLEEKKQEFIKNLSEKDTIKPKTASAKRLLEDYAYIFHSLNELPYYRGLTEYMHEADAPQKALMYFIKKSLEKQEEKEDKSGLIVNPYG